MKYTMDQWFPTCAPRAHFRNKYENKNNYLQYIVNKQSLYPLLPVIYARQNFRSIRLLKENTETILM